MKKIIIGLNKIEKIKADLKDRYFATDSETYNHSIRVADTFIFDNLNLSVFASLIILSLLHDVVEDGKSTYDELKARYGLSNEIISALNALTRRPKEEYFVYIARVKANSLASKVKMADLLDNIHRNSNNHSFDSLRKRYRKAFKLLSL